MTNPHPRPPNWLDIATSHAATKWLKLFLQSQLPKLLSGNISDQDFADRLDQELEKRDLLSPTQQKNYRSNTVQVIKTIDELHPAIALISLSTEQYREINDQQRGKLADRETRYISSNQAQSLVDTATALLDSAEWSEVGAGLAVLIGRRISEILLSSFSPKSPWSLFFTGLAKKASSEEMTIEIPTLAPAPIVLSAIQRLQEGLQIDDLKLNSLSAKIAKQTVNQRFSESVASKCDEHFCGLVPPRRDRDSLYTHLFRAVYASIAAHWFCPPNVPEHNFKAEIQGHFTLDKNGKKLPNFSARSNYDDYAIGTPDSNRDGRLGIKLGTLPGLEIIDAFRKDKDHQNSPGEVRERQVTLLDEPTINAFVYRSANLLLSPDSTAVAIAVTALSGLLPTDLLHSNWEKSGTLSLSGDAKETYTLTDSGSILSAIHKINANRLSSLDGLEAIVSKTFDNLIPVHSLNDVEAIYAQIALYRFRPPDMGDDAFLEAINAVQSPSYQLAVDDRGTWLNLPHFSQLNSLIHNPMTAQSKSAHKPRIKPVNLDLDLLQKACDFAGVPIGKGHPYDKAASELFRWLQNLDLVETDEPTQSHQPEQLQQQPLQPLDWQRALTEQARTLGTLSTQLESLSQQVQDLQAENTQLKVNQGDSTLVTRLQTENTQLKQELKQAQSQLQGIQKFLGASPEAKTQNLSPLPTATPEPQPQKPETSTQKTSQPRQKRDPLQSLSKINQIIDALIQWNQSADPNLRLRIATNPIKSIANLIGANYQPTIAAALQERKDQLNELHSQLMLGARHNATVKNKEHILKQVARDILNLDNWDDTNWIG